MGEERFILNVNDGVDTIHREAGLTESCNTDDIEGRQSIDVSTAASMLDRGQARRCEHCFKEET